MEDKRVFARISARFPLRFLNPDTGREGEAETLDISANGVGLLTNNNLTLSASLEMWMCIPDRHEPLYIRGQVIWFGAAPDDNRQRIGVRLDKAELMGLARVLWLKRRG